MLLTKAAAQEINSIFDRIDTEANILRFIGAADLLKSSKFIDSLMPADNDGVTSVIVDDNLYNLFVPKLIEWQDAHPQDNASE